MAQGPGQSAASLARGFSQLSNAQKVGLLVGLAAVIALVYVAVLWLRTPEYRVLYSNLSDRDGGEVIGALAALNVPYKMAENGTAILVPSSMVYDTRLKLASQGLPRGGAVGFELMETQKFGVSQFAEQVNYQRALAGELARTIQSLAPVASARVHLAIPRPSVFVREQQRPSASVLVSLYPGRSLDEGQVSAIQNLVASSVPELVARSVTVVDHTGHLLNAGGGDGLAQGGLDASQLKYVHALEAAYATRIESILQPLFGAGNVRAQVTATLDFAQTEQTSEIFKPNPSAPTQTIRSQQTIDTNSNSPTGPSGVPGALSNQPPGASSAPLIAPGGTPAAIAPAATSTSSHRETTINYEVDKTINHVKGEVGAIKRLAVAVVVNHRRTADREGKAAFTPLTDAEMAQIGDLVREAMGYNKARGDTVNVVNAPFSAPEVEVGSVGTPSVWADFLQSLLSPTGILEVGKWIGLALVLVYGWFGLLRPALRDLMQIGRPGAPSLATIEGIEPGLTRAPEAPMAQQRSFESDLQAAKEIAKQDPRIVANVVKDWVGRE
jgi:flagellar M-ring protein FliF